MIKKLDDDLIYELYDSEETGTSDFTVIANILYILFHCKPFITILLSLIFHDTFFFSDHVVRTPLPIPPG